MFETILLVEDERSTRKGLTQFLQGLDYDVITAHDGEEAYELFIKEKPDLVLTDIRMPKMDGIALLEKIKANSPNAKVILITAYGTVDDAVGAMKKGAFHYLTKPVNLDELQLLMKSAFTRHQLEEENRELKQDLLSEKFYQGKLIAESSKMKDLLETVDKITSSNASVLIEGESGTGKELIARRIHEHSNRQKQPFVALHCAALTDTLLSSELFGHEKGAFTGATERRKGRFERAHQGTLFLDEIGEISKETQVKLLRVLQEGEFERVGGTKTIKADVRVLSATNKNLIEEVREKRFREDLYYRINVIYLNVPPLRERKEDIPLLVDYFIKQYSNLNSRKIKGIDEKTLEAFTKYSWPGNIRELKNIIERMVVLSVNDILQSEQVPEDIRKHTMPGSVTPTLNGINKITDAEKELIRRNLNETKGNKSLAAEKLGISRRTLYRKLEEYKIS